MNDETTARIHQWLGTWSPGVCCPAGKLHYPPTRNDVRICHSYCAECGFDYTAHEYEALGSHHIPIPPLTEVHAIRCLEKLAEQNWGVSLGSYKGGGKTLWNIRLFNDTDEGSFVSLNAFSTPTEAIFAATDAYILSLKKWS
jgi:hypothetical protein